MIDRPTYEQIHFDIPRPRRLRTRIARKLPWVLVAVLITQAVWSLK